MSGHAVIARGLAHQFDTVAGPLAILQGVDLQVDRGASVAIVGASGCGESTLLGLLAGLDIPTSGTVELCGTALGSLDEDGRALWRSQHTGFVFQAFHLLADLTALENVLLPLELFGRPRKQAKKWLDFVGLGDRCEHRPAQLSGGEQQRVALARAFALEPEVLFADEPTANLDRNTAKTVVDTLFDLQQQTSSALVLVTHDETVAARCDTVHVLIDGRLQ